MTALPRLSRTALLFGTEEIVPPPRTLTIGRLGVTLDRGNLRYITWGGREVLRAISYIVRDTNWGTYALQLEDLEVNVEADRFIVTYRAECSGAEGDFAYSTRIEGDASGRLCFAASGRSEQGFRTNRTGFVVLHGLDGVVGHPVEIEHTDGRRTATVFPQLVQGAQPIMDIRSLRHEPAPGLAVTVRMEGEAYEMEDQRNWTDASFKTYVRPLSRGFPYAIPARESVEQSITLTIEGIGESVRPAIEKTVVVSVGGIIGTMPEVGVAVLPGESSAPVLALLPGYFVARLDLRRPWDVEQLTHLTGRALDLDLIIPGRSPEAELAPVATALQKSAVVPARVMVVPERDLHMHPTGYLPPGEANYEQILAAARAAFPASQIGGGMVVGFPELNRSRPPRDIAFVAHSTQAIVHAADDTSVMETLEALPHVIRTTRSFAGDVRYRLGPATIGAPAPFYVSPPTDNPRGVRVPAAADDPRQKGLFAAAFAVGYLATAAAHGVNAVTLSASSASLEGARGPVPLYRVIEGLARLGGCPLVALSSSQRQLVGFAAVHGSDLELWLANLGPDPQTVRVDGASFIEAWTLNALALSDSGPGKPTLSSLGPQEFQLDAYAVKYLRGDWGRAPA